MLAVQRSSPAGRTGAVEVDAARVDRESRLTGYRGQEGAQIRTLRVDDPPACDADHVRVGLGAVAVVAVRLTAELQLEHLTRGLERRQRLVDRGQADVRE